MKQSATNTFRDGLNLDLHPVTTPNTVLTDNLNGTFITYNGNEFMLQNDRGNHDVGTLSKGFVPICAKELNGIIYIASLNENCDLEIGTYPSPDWTLETEHTLINTYSPLKNVLKSIVYKKREVITHTFKITLKNRGYDQQSKILDYIDWDLMLEGGDYDKWLRSVLIKNLPNFSVTITQSGKDHEITISKVFEISRFIWGLFLGKYALTSDTNHFTNYSFNDAGDIVTLTAEDSETVVTAISDYLHNNSISYTYFDPHDQLTREIIQSDDFQFTGDSKYKQFESNIISNLNRDYSSDWNWQTELGFSENDLITMLSSTLCLSGSGREDIGNMQDIFDNSLNGYVDCVYEDPIEYVDTDEIDFEQSEIQNFILENSEFDPEAISMELQTSFDGSVNIILNQKLARTLLVNSGFTAMGDLARLLPQNFYKFDKLQSLTKLIYNTDILTHVDLIDIDTGGQLKGGNYTFYFCYSDDNFNTTDLIAQSGLVSVFHGYKAYESSGIVFDKASVRGTLSDEHTDKLVRLKLSPIDTSYNNIVVYYSREYSDTNGYLMVEFKRLERTFKIYDSDELTITITGTDKETSVSEEDLNIRYLDINSAKTAAQSQNMLFLGNVENQITGDMIKQLTKLSYQIPFEVAWRSVDPEWNDARWIYEEVGYWPDDFYKFGIVYIFKGGVRSNVFPVMGCSSLDDDMTDTVKGIEFRDNFNDEYKLKYLNKVYSFNKAGVFRVTSNDYRPWHLNCEIPGAVASELSNLGVIGYTIVRQKRIPKTYCQGITLNVDKTYGYPYFLTAPIIFGIANNRTPIYDSEQGSLSWSGGDSLPGFDKTNVPHAWEDDDAGQMEVRRGILSLDATFNSELRNVITSIPVTISPLKNVKIDRTSDTGQPLRFEVESYEKDLYPEQTLELTYVQSNCKAKVLGDGVYQTVFSTVVGDPTEFDIRNTPRGKFVPFLATNEPIVQYTRNTDATGVPRTALFQIVNISSASPDATIYEQVKNNVSPYYEITDRHNLTDAIKIYRGDFYICELTVRLYSNLIGSTSPVNTLIKRNRTYGEARTGDYDIADINNVPMGAWLTFTVYSSSNLSIRTVNDTVPSDYTLYGSFPAFSPYIEPSWDNSKKWMDSELYNSGYGQSLGRVRHNAENITYFTKTEYNTRVTFSNINVTDNYINGYRVFQGLAYKDFDKQYGEIVKLLPWGNNLFCTFEHGLSIIPINEKALIQTTTEQTIHIYGHGVIPEQMTIVSQDYGSKYADSVIKTPIGIYGVDTDAKKIWRFSSNSGFETLSDMKIETFLNKNLSPNYSIDIDKCDVRTHYNAFKGDVMFTWYSSDGRFSICYNERQSVWTTRYDWLPIVSENKNGEFYSLQYSEVPENSSDQNVHIWQHDVDLDVSKPTHWFNRQHVFEFEFAVSDPVGVHKIFENLQIISNNVQPEELQFEFIGDSYLFNKARIYHAVFNGWNENRKFTNETLKSIVYDTDPTNIEGATQPGSTELTYNKPNLANDDDIHPFRNASRLNDRGEVIYGEIIKTENATEQYHLRIPQECRNIETWGRRLGNMQYKEDSWYTTIEPIIYNANLNDPKQPEPEGVTKWNSARIRDKWCKIRVRYSGEDLAVITAIKTIINI